MPVGPCDICGLSKNKWDRHVPSNSGLMPGYRSTKCSLLIFIYVLLSPETRTDETWTHSNQMFFGEIGNVSEKAPSLVSELRNIKVSLSPSLSLYLV
jgi:hypothetical protein